MSERSKHLFHFPASAIAAAAAAEAEYHRERVEHWRQRMDAAVARVRETISAKLVEQDVTGGSRYSVAVDYGDRQAWDEYQLAASKVDTHRLAADRFETEHTVYATQGDRLYELDSEDVHHFRLGGQEREQ